MDDAIDIVDRLIDSYHRQGNELAAERRLANQLADALKMVLHDRPSAHTDNVWAVINHALNTYEEVRCER